MTDQLSVMKDETTVLGSGDWYVENDDRGSFCYSGIWQGGKVIALVLSEDSDPSVVRQRGERIVKAVNAHDKLVEALEDCLTYGSMTGGDWVVEKARAALAAAGEQV